MVLARERKINSWKGLLRLMEGLESMQRRKIKKRKAYFEYSKNMNRKYDILKGKPIRLFDT